jgi:hypothetical protein
MNEKHLLGNRAPDNVLFRVEPVDGRIPAIEDGASWPVLLRNYEPATIIKDFLVLHRAKNPGQNPELFPIETKTFYLRERVYLPQITEPIFAEIEIRPTILGRLANALFKPAQLEISFELNNGSQKQYRIIAGMAKSGFLISPLITSTDEFAFLYGDRSYLSRSLVKSFSITSSGGHSFFWNDKYIVAFSGLKSQPPLDISSIVKFDSMIEDVSKYNVIKRDKCDGAIDAVNGASPSSGQISTSRLLKVQGWFASSVDKPTLPDAVVIFLIDDRGKKFFFQTRRTIRPDVGAVFGKPELNNSGYVANVDVSGFVGQFTLGLAIKDLGNVEICPSSNFTAQINIPKH